MEITTLDIVLTVIESILLFAVVCYNIYFLHRLNKKIDVINEKLFDISDVMDCKFHDLNCTVYMSSFGKCDSCRYKIKCIEDEE